MGEIIPHTLLSNDRIQILEKCVEQTKDLLGSIAEIGSYKGGAAYYINKHAYGKSVYLFDTFEGMPLKGEYDSHPIGDFADTSYEQVVNAFKDFTNVKIIKGIFPESVKGVIGEDEKFCFVHLDGDQYQTTIDALNFFYPKMVQNGIILFDDYGWLKGVDKAIEEFFEGKPEQIIQEAKYQCYIIKQ